MQNLKKKSIQISILLSLFPFIPSNTPLQLIVQLINSKLLLFSADPGRFIYFMCIGMIEYGIDK